MTLQKENMQLLERLQKTESQLQKARSGEADDLDDVQVPKTVTLSPDVIVKLDGIDERML